MATPVKPKPYIGVTGFMSFEETFALECRIPGMIDSDQHPYTFMCGVLASWKTLSHQPLGDPKRYPLLEDIHRIFPVRREKRLNLIHYNSREPGLHRQLSRLQEVCGHVEGFQLNIAWPDVGELTAWRQSAPRRTRLVLQVGAGAYILVGTDPKALVARLRGYGAIMTDILFDLSGGRGQPIDLDRARPALSELYAAFGDSCGIGVAGGLGPDSLDLIDPLLAEFPSLSFDAEGRLRTPEDDLDLDKARDYLRAAIFKTLPRRHP